MRPINWKDSRGIVWHLTRTQGEVVYLSRVNEHQREVTIVVSLEKLLSEYIGIGL